MEADSELEWAFEVVNMTSTEIHFPPDFPEILQPENGIDAWNDSISGINPRAPLEMDISAVVPWQGPVEPAVNITNSQTLYEDQSRDPPFLGMNDYVATDEWLFDQNLGLFANGEQLPNTMIFNCGDQIPISHNRTWPLDSHTANMSDNPLDEIYSLDPVQNQNYLSGSTLAENAPRSQIQAPPISPNTQESSPENTNQGPHSNSLQPNLPKKRRRPQYSSRISPVYLNGGTFLAFSSKPTKAKEDRVQKPNPKSKANNRRRSCLRCYSYHLKCDGKSPCGECLKAARNPKLWTQLSLCGPVVLADNDIFTKWAFHHVTIDLAFTYFAHVTAPRYGCAEWDWNGGNRSYQRVGVNIAAAVNRINTDSGSRMTEWFDIPKYFRQKYPEGLSQNSMDLDNACKSVYRASDQLRQLAFKACFGPSDDIDPEDMFLIQFYVPLQAEFGKEALTVLQRNINRLMTNKHSPVQDGLHLYYWAHLLLQILESMLRFPSSVPENRENLGKAEMLKEILLYYARIIRGRIPKQDLSVLYSIHLSFEEAKAALPLYQQNRRLGPKRPPSFNYFEEEALLVVDDFANLQNNFERKIRLLSMSAKLSLPTLVGKITLMEALLTKALDPSRVGKNLWDKLLQNISKGHATIAEMLSGNGIDICERDSDGYCRPLILAVFESDIKLVQLLLNTGADPSAREYRGWSLLHIATRRGDTEMTQLLLNNRADVDATLESGQTPLHIACMFHFPQICERLIDYKADPKSIDDYGHTSVDWAKSDHDTLRSLGSITETTTEEMLQKRLILQASIRKDLCSLDEKQYSRLAKKLIYYCEDVESACILWEHQIKKLPDGRIKHRATCSSCTIQDGIIGARFVCRTCADVDFCERCMETYAEDNSVRGCSGHSFVKVPRPAWYKLENGAVNMAGDSIDAFVKELSQLYAVL